MPANRHEAEALIDRAIFAMREIAPPKGPPADVLERVRSTSSAVAASLVNSTESSAFVLNRRPTSPIPSRRAFNPAATLMRPRNLSVVAVTIAVLLVAVQWIPSDSQSNLAVADVREQVAKTKSVQYVRTMTEPNTKYRGVERVTILGADRKRSEITWDPPVLSPSPDAKKVTRVISITITNAREHKSLTLYPEIKEFAFDHWIASPLPVELPPSDDYPMPRDLPESFLDLKDTPPDVDFIAWFQRTFGDEAQRLPEKMVDGKPAVGFLVERKEKWKSGTVRWSRTCWVDPMTKLPVRIEASYRGTQRPGTRCDDDWVISNILFDAPIDAKLFNIDPPEGWTDRHTRVAKP